jgi:hypothetical protein
MLQLRLSPFSKTALRMRRKLPQMQRQSHAADVSIFPARLSTVQRPNCLPVKSINALNFAPVHVHWQTKRACVRIVPPCTRLIEPTLRASCIEPHSVQYNRVTVDSCFAHAPLNLPLGRRSPINSLSENSVRTRARLRLTHRLLSPASVEQLAWPHRVRTRHRSRPQPSASRWPRRFYGDHCGRRGTNCRNVPYQQP